MRPFCGALGLRAYEYAASTENSFVLRWCAPLDRRSAAKCKTRLENEARISIHGVDALEARGTNVAARYLLGGAYASLRRVLIVESTGEDLAAAEKSALHFLEELGLAPIGSPPEPQAIERNAAAFRVARTDPRLFSRLFFEAEAWPPEDRAGGAHNFEIARDLSMIDRGAFQALSVHLRSGAEATARALTHGVIARRWRLFGDGAVRPGLSADEDLRSGGAAFAFARLLTPELAGARWGAEYEYALVLHATQLARADRFILPRDRYGAFHALADALSEAELRDAITSRSLSPLHELLFFDEIPAAAITAVYCRDAEAERQLRRLLKHEPCKISVSDRLPDLENQ